MEILTESQLAERLDFARPLPLPDHATPTRGMAPPEDSIWRIPFEYGTNAKGTRISVGKARQIVAELRAAVAEDECREMRKHFDRERERADAALKQSAAHQLEAAELRGTVAHLERELRFAKKNQRRRVSRKK